jgi:hypothetical protein
MATTVAARASVSALATEAGKPPTEETVPDGAVIFCRNRQFKLSCVLLSIKPSHEATEVGVNRSKAIEYAVDGEASMPGRGGGV